MTARAAGIRATVEFPQAVPCPIAAAARETGSVIDRVWSSVTPNGEATSVSEFLVSAEAPPSMDGLTPVLSLGRTHLLRAEHGDGPGCPCQLLGRHGCAVQQYSVRPESLRLVFHAVDYPELQAVVNDLLERFPAADVKRLLRDPDSGTGGDVVPVDRGRLTDRQLQVLQTAYRMGYFDRPRAANATEVADELDIDGSTFSEHLRAAEGKVLADLLEEGP